MGAVSDVCENGSVIENPDTSITPASYNMFLDNDSATLHSDIISVMDNVTLDTDVSSENTDTNHIGTEKSENSVKDTDNLVKETPVSLFHPCMKVSFSDGSLATYATADLDDLAAFEGDVDPKVAGSVVSPFSKLRVKMSGLTLPTIPSPQTKRRMAEQAAQHNKLKSQLRFSQCKTRILLL